MKTEKKEFGEAKTVSGVYFFNERFNKFQVNIDCIEFELVDDFFRFETIEEAELFIKETYNVKIKLNNI